MKRLVGAILLCASLAAAADKKTKLKKEPEPSPLDRYIADAEREKTSLTPTAGSLWVPSARYSDLAMDLRAHRVSDIVTIVVNEKASAVSTGTVKTGRTSSVNSSIINAAGITKAAGPLANLAKLSTDNQLNGTGTTTRDTSLTTSLSARVTHVLPNGYLVIEGTKNVQVNSENQIVSVRGVIRPTDLDNTNVIQSDHIAELDVRVNGKGIVGDAIRRPFFLYRLLLGLLPF
ncbi:MAG: flagellar basal body L-ring protein FlgH [Acidobacteriia bacterium]|nr:flagellar basal body L-ring protein FlgH [Terriglobia bacterium]